MCTIDIGFSKNQFMQYSYMKLQFKNANNLIFVKLDLKIVGMFHEVSQMKCQSKRKKLRPPKGRHTQKIFFFVWSDY